MSLSVIEQDQTKWASLEVFAPKEGEDFLLTLCVIIENLFQTVEVILTLSRNEWVFERIGSCNYIVEFVRKKRMLTDLDH